MNVEGDGGRGWRGQIKQSAVVSPFPVSGHVLMVVCLFVTDLTPEGIAILRMFKYHVFMSIGVNDRAFKGASVFFYLFLHSVGRTCTLYLSVDQSQVF